MWIHMQDLQKVFKFNQDSKFIIESALIHIVRIITSYFPFSLPFSPEFCHTSTSMIKNSITSSGSIIIHHLFSAMVCPTRQPPLYFEESFNHHSPTLPPWPHHSFFWIRNDTIIILIRGIITNKEKYPNKNKCIIFKLWKRKRRNCKEVIY